MKLLIFFGLFGESFLYILALFLKVKVHNWRMCLGLQNFKYFFWYAGYFLYTYIYFFWGGGG